MRGDSENRVLAYEVWYDFIIAESPRTKDRKYFIRERCVCVDSKSQERVVYHPRSSAMYLTYFRVEILRPAILGPTGEPPHYLYMGYIPDHYVCVASDELTQSRSEGKPRARYVEHLYLISPDTYSKQDKKRKPILAVRRSILTPGEVTHLSFTVNIPLRAYHISPPPFGELPSVKNCKGFDKEQWYAAVFEHNHEDPFRLDCEESKRVANSFHFKLLLPEKIWQLKLLVEDPKEGRTYGVHLPLPLLGFDDGI